MTDLKNYAEAVFLIAEEENALELTKNELEALNKVMEENPEYTTILDTPAISKEERLGLVGEAFSGFSENVRNLICIITEKREIHAIPKLYAEFMSLYNKKMGIIPVEVISAVELSPEQTEKLGKKLCEKLSGKVVIKNTVDKKILGGLILRYNSVQLDGSVKARLDSIAESLRSAVV